MFWKENFKEIIIAGLAILNLVVPLAVARTTSGPRADLALIRDHIETAKMLSRDNLDEKERLEEALRIAVRRYANRMFAASIKRAYALVFAFAVATSGVIVALAFATNTQDDWGFKLILGFYALIAALIVLVGIFILPLLITMHETPANEAAFEKFLRVALKIIPSRIRRRMFTQSAVSGSAESPDS